MANETLETRTLRQAKNVNLGDFMVPQGGGNATPDYVSNYNPWAGVGESLGHGISGVGEALGKQRDKAAKEAENQAESDMYLEVYNIQRTPSSMMTASQKEIEIDRVVNKYSGIVSVPRIHAVLDANGAQPEKTYTRMSEQKGKEQLVAMQATQNEDLSKLAISMDPSYAAQSPAVQIEAGRQISNIQSRFKAAFDHVLSLGDSLDEQTLAARDGLLDETSVYALQLFPRDARVALYSGKWTQNDTEAFINRFSMALSQKINPVTGTVLSKQQADFYARTVAERLLAQSDKERLEASKKTVEYQNAWMDLKRNQLGLSGTPQDQALYILYGKDPATLEKAFGTAVAKEKLASDMELIGATSDGHTLIPGGVSNMSVSLMAENGKMPLQQADARAVLTGRQASQPQSIVSNQNLLEQIDSYQDGWLNTLPSDSVKQNVDALKQAIPADIQTNIQSLVQANLAPQEGEGWIQRAFRAVNNYAVGTGTTQDIDNPEQVRGANAVAINNMLNDYADRLRRIGMEEKDVTDIISQGIKMSGVPEAKGNIQNMINAVSNMVANDMFKGSVLEGTIAETVASRVISNVAELKERSDKPEKESASEQQKELTDDEIKKTPEYKELFRDIMSKARTGVMTDIQAKNELDVAVNNIRNNIQGNGDQVSYNASYTQASSFAPNIGSKALSVVNNIIGVKKANAMEAGIELTKQNELSPAMEKKYSSGNNYIVYKDHKGHKTIGGGVLLDAEARRYFREKGYMNLGTGHQVPKSVVDEYMKKKYNEKNDLTERQLKSRGIDTKQLPSSLRCVCNDLGYIGKPVKGFFDKVAKYMKAKTEQEKRMCIIDMKKHIDANIEGNKDRKDKLKTILDSL